MNNAKPEMPDHLKEKFKSRALNTIVRPVDPQPFPDPSRIEFWGKGSGAKGISEWVPTSNSGKVGLFTPFQYECPWGYVSDLLMIQGEDEHVMEIYSIKIIRLHHLVMEEWNNAGYGDKPSPIWDREHKDSPFKWSENPWVWVIKVNHLTGDQL